MSGLKRIGLVVLVVLFVSAASAAPKKHCVSPAAASQFLQSAHDIQAGQTKASEVSKSAITSATGNIVVLEADPQLLTLSNTFDLSGSTLRFIPAQGGRYAYTIESSNFDGQVSQTIALGDDGSAELVFKNFNFPFGRKNFDRCYISSNGSITFGTPDPQPPSADSITGNIPRIAGFFTDLNPQNSGAIFVNQTFDKVTVSWLKVPEFFNQNQFDYGQNTFQIVMYKTGMIDIVFTNEMSATQGFVGLIPGFDKIPIRFVDFSSGQAAGRFLLSFVENFHDYVSIDIQSLMKSLYASMPDRFDFVTLFSNFDLNPVPGAQAFAINVRNNVHGIGNPSDKKPIFKDNAEYGSAGQLQNITFFGNLHQYPDDPTQTLADGDVSLLGILAHEVAHRWLAYVKIFRDGKPTDSLLGRDHVHWSFFFDSEGSFLEGNSISQKSSNQFSTGKPFQRYSDLDLYLMGFKSPAEVRDSFYVDGASNFSPDFPFRPESSPEDNVTFNGSAIPLHIGDIVAANGPRKPNSSTSQREFTQLFVLITNADQPATEEEIHYLETLRSIWTDFFHTATDGIATVQTTLDHK
jgi:hypothetical protein